MWHEKRLKNLAYKSRRKCIAYKCLERTRSHLRPRRHPYRRIAQWCRSSGEYFCIPPATQFLHNTKAQGKLGDEGENCSPSRPKMWQETFSRIYIK